ncbi:MAG: hypothetical protein ABR511_15235 [Acidimicrobiales bacterium]
MRAHYRRPSARLELAVTAVVLCYGGGAAMFSLHALYRGEAGPPINNWFHWGLDSTLGFVALTPVLALLLPLATRVVGGRTAWVRPLLVGATFTLVTGPGPMIHDRFVGAGRPLAHLATTVFGTDPSVALSHVGAVEHSLSSEVALQLAVGLPVYVLLALGVAAVGSLTHRDECRVRSLASSPALARHDVDDVDDEEAAA